MSYLASYGPWVFYIVIFIVGYSKLQSQVKMNSDKLDDHTKLLTSGNGGGAPFITEPEHDKLQATCQAQIYQKIDNMETNMAEMKETMKKGDECRTEAREETSNQLSAIRKDMGTFQKGLYDIINPLVTKVAVSESEINHINEKIRK